MISVTEDREAKFYLFILFIEIIAAENFNLTENINPRLKLNILLNKEHQRDTRSIGFCLNKTMRSSNQSLDTD